MGALTTAMSAASITMGAYQSRQEAQLKQLQNNLAADTLEAQAARKELEAGEALKLGELNQAEHIAAGRLDIAEQRVGYAHGGVKVNEGSAVEVAADKAAWSEYGRQKIEYEAGMESWGLQYDAAILRQEAANTRATGSAGSGGGLQAALGVGGKFVGLMTK